MFRRVFLIFCVVFLRVVCIFVFWIIVCVFGWWCVCCRLRILGCCILGFVLCVLCEMVLFLFVFSWW